MTPIKYVSVRQAVIETLAIMLMAFAAIATCFVPACQTPGSTTQPASPLQIVVEDVLLRTSLSAAGQAYTAGKLSYPQYQSVVSVIQTIQARLNANGGNVTQATIDAAIRASRAAVIDLYLPTPTILPPPATQPK